MHGNHLVSSCISFAVGRVISFSFVVGGDASCVVGGDTSCVVGRGNFCSLNSLGILVTGINKQYEGLPECGIIKVK